MSARKTVKRLAQEKNLTIGYISDYVGYKHPHHFTRALDNSSAISAKRVVLLAEVLEQTKDYMLTVLTRSK